MVCEPKSPVACPSIRKEKIVLMANAIQLVSRLMEALDRREQDYLKALENAEGEFKVSFAARAGEVGIFKDDLEFLLERLTEVDKVEHKGYTGMVHYDGEGPYYGDVDKIPDVVTFEGKTLEEAKKAFCDSVDDYLDFCASLGEEPNKP